MSLTLLFVPHSLNVQSFSFVLTNLDAQWTFGFCRLSPNSETALVSHTFVVHSGKNPSVSQYT